MSGKIIVYIIAALILAGIGYSCKSTNNVSSDKLLQKRKYQSGFYIDRVHKKKARNYYANQKSDNKKEALLVPEIIQENDDLNHIEQKEIQSQEENKRIIGENTNEAEVSDENTSKFAKQKALKKSDFSDEVNKQVLEDSPPKKKLEGLGVSSLSLLILSLLIISFSTSFGIVLFAIAFIISLFGLFRIIKKPELYKGKGFTIASLILSFAALAVIILYSIPL